MRNLIVFLSVLIILSACVSNAYKSIENLRKAINDESTASEMYAQFAKRAEADSMFRVAIMFRAISASENIHANNHIAALRIFDEDFEPVIDTIVVRSTLENLKSAKKNEMNIIDNIYPSFIKTAIDDEFEEAIHSFKSASIIENKHNLFYYKAISEIEFRNGKDTTLNSQWMVCPTCGNIYAKDNVEPLCSICKTPNENFLLFYMKSE